MRKELQGIQHVLRRLRLLNLVEWIRYVASVCRCRSSNGAFKKSHPDFSTPPKHLAYDAYSAPDWNYYFSSGTHTARDIAAIARQYIRAQPGLHVLEWGCGPARVIRHMPSALGEDAQVYGSDYNEESVAWGAANVPGVRFSRNGLMPPLPFEDSFFDLVYAISVFTHLSEETCRAWIHELQRVLKPDGIVFFTTHSDAGAQYLLPQEKKEYEENGFCVRGLVQEGKKMFGAWLNPSYVKGVLLAEFELLDHAPPGRFRYIHTQDAWIARKK
jgi:ubiquinone/menaquinone biosynthesis C-methylase UbiE